MRKILPIILLVAMAVCLTSCDPEAASKLGKFMGEMGGNVYGISANMKDVDKATGAVNDAIKPDGSGNYDKSELMKASSLVDSISKINGSTQKIDALKEDLSKPAASEANNDSLRLALSEAAGDIYSKIDAINVSGLAEAQANLVNSVKESLASLPIADVPTKADVVTIAILNEIADAVVDITDNYESYVTGEGTNLTEAGKAVVDRGLSCLETLKLITAVGNLNLLGDMSPSAIMDAMGRDANDIDADRFSEVLTAMGNPIAKFVALLVDITEDDVQFSESKWNDFVFQAKTLKSAYEMIGCMYMPCNNMQPISTLDNILDYDIDLGLTIDDFVLYFISMTACTADTVWDMAKVVGGFGAFLEANFDMMTNDVDDTEETFDIPALFETAMEELKTQFESMKSDGWSILSTIAVILNDSGYKTILNLFSEEGTVSGIFDIFDSLEG